MEPESEAIHGIRNGEHGAGSGSANLGDGDIGVVSPLLRGHTDAEFPWYLLADPTRGDLLRGEGI